MSIVIIDNYDSFTFNLYQLLQAQTEDEIVVRRNDALSYDQLIEMKPAGIVLSPGPGHPGVAADFGICVDVVKNADSHHVPVLGVCLGHQGIAHYLGATVERAPQIMHGKTSKITITASSPIFNGLPSTFNAMRYHSLVVSDDEQLPASLQITAREDQQNLIMAIQHKELKLYGVQFHPESIGTPEGQKILRNFIELC